MQIEVDTTGFLFRMSELTPLSMWLGAVLGVLVSAAFAGVVKLGRWLRRVMPIRQLLGEFADNAAPCAIFIRSMFSDDGRYKSREPNYLPSKTENEVRIWRNIRDVSSTSDMHAATDFTNLLGQVGKREGVLFHSVEEDWNLWDTNVATIGGSYKSDRIFEYAKPQRVVLNSDTGAFETSSGESFRAVEGDDFGSIYKVTHPATQRTSFMVIGLGSAGTKAASYYLRTKARYLGMLLGGRDFALVVHIRVAHGSETAQPRWCYPKPSWWRRLRHPWVWRRTLRLACAEGEKKQEADQAPTESPEHLDGSHDSSSSSPIRVK